MFVFFAVLLFALPAHAGPVVGIVGAIAGGAVASALGGGILGSLAGFAVSSAFNQIGGRALSKKPKGPVGVPDTGRTQVVRSAIESHKVIYGTAKVSGPLVYVATADDGAGPATPPKDNKMLYMVIPLAGHEVEEITEVYFNDQLVTFDSGATEGYVFSAPFYLNGASYAIVKKHLGAPDQEADPLFVAEAPGWTAEHRLRGLAYLAVRLEYSPDVFPLGIPNVSAVVKGKNKVHDPRTGAAAWTDNAALCVRDYMASGYGFNCDADEIDDGHFVAAANVCDEVLALSSGGARARYTCNGVVDTANAPLDNLAALVTSVAGAVTYVQGAFRLHAGAYDAPAGTITADMLAGPVRAELRTARKELFNAVKGTYVDPGKNWQPTDFPFVTNAAYEGEDNGERIYTDVELPFTNHPEAAQRIGKILLEKARQGVRAELSLNHSAMRYAVFDVVSVTLDTFGWDAKPFRVLKVATTGTGPVVLSLQEESSASYDWNSGEASATDAAPDTNLPDPLNVAAPGAPTVTEALYTTTDGSGVKTKARVTWGESSDAFVRDYQLEYKPAAGEYAIAGRTAATSFEVLDLAPGTYLFRVKAISSLGVSSGYGPVTTQGIYGLTAPPADLSNLSLNVIGNAAHLSWDQATDLDVLNGGGVRFRYTPAIVGAAWNAAVDIGPALPGISTSAVLPLLAGTYMAKFVDSTGNASTSASTVTTTVVSLLELNVVQAITEHPTFAGTKTGMAFDEALGGIKLAGATDWDDYPGNVDAWPMIDSLGGVSSAGAYDFANAIDLGAVYTSKLTAAITASGYDTGDLFDARLNSIDTWTSFDGGGESTFAGWDVFQSTVTVNAHVAPDGTNTAARLTEDAGPLGLPGLYVEDVPALGLNGESVTLEAYAKPNGRNLAILFDWEGEPFGSRVTAVFDLATGAIQSTSADNTASIVETGIEAARNGYYRVWVTATNGYLPAYVYSMAIFLVDLTFDETYTGDGTSGAYLWNYRAYAGSLRDAAPNDDTNAALYLRTTDDDPSGTPTWGDWRQFFVGDYTARAFEFQVRMTSGNTNHNILVTELGVTVDMPDRVAEGKQITSGAGAYTATYTNPFREAPALTITPYNLGTGDYYEIANEDETGFDVAFKNAAGATVSRRFDYTAKGYGKQI